MTARHALVFLLSSIFCSPIFAASPDFEALLSPSLIRAIQISPDGKHLALSVFHEDRHSLQILETATKKRVGGLDVRVAGGRSEVGRFWWANNDRVVGQVVEAAQGSTTPHYYGELFAVDVDGTNPKMIFGTRAHLFDQGFGRNPSRITPERAWAFFLDRYPSSDTQILIARQHQTSSQAALREAVLLNIYTGKVSAPLAKADLPGSSIFADEQGVPRVIVGDTLDGERQVKARFGENDWKQLPDDQIGNKFRPVSTLHDDRFYVFDDHETDRRSLFQYDIQSRSLELIYQNEHVDVASRIASSDLKEVLAVRVYDGNPKYILLGSNHPESKLFKDLLAAFPGSTINITSRTSNGSHWVVYKHASTDPGSYYLFDTAEKHLSLLSVSKPGLSANTLSPMNAVSFDSFDGLTIHGYYTPPLTMPESGQSPLVVLVHGGPRLRDYWGFNPEVQLLATSGYAVLQINYRGSAGYGKTFEDAGNLHWGDHVQKDLIAGTRWALENMSIDPDRVCIMGSSFGAYSAVMSATMAPDLYRCVVANAGVYDLELMHKTGDIKGFYNGPSYLKEVIGDQPERLAKQSPVNHIEQLRAPVFIAHGKKDRRAPYAHARNLIKALKKHNKRYELFTRKTEGHGYYDTTNRVEFYRRALGFIAETTGTH